MCGLSWWRDVKNRISAIHSHKRAHLAMANIFSKLLKEGILTGTPLGQASHIRKILRYICYVIAALAVMYAGYSFYALFQGVKDDGTNDGKDMPTKAFESDYARRRFIAKQKNRIASAERDIEITKANVRQGFVQNHAAPYIGASRRLRKNMRKNTYLTGAKGELWERIQRESIEAIVGPVTQPQYGPRGERL